MENTTAIASAAIGAVVAVGVTLVTNHIQQAKSAQAHQAEVAAACEEWRRQGYYEGRESVLQQFGEKVHPEAFTTR